MKRPRPQPLTDEEREMWILLETLAGKQSITDFVQLMTPSYQPPTHLRGLIEVLWDVETVGNVKACVSVPPRHSKTETLLHFIAWYLARHPERTVGYITYEAGLAQSKSRKVRDLAQKAGVILREDSRSVREWRTPQNGGLIATGVGGPLTGHGVDLLVVDDPTKNREEAESILVRQRNYDWFTSTALTRVEPNGSVLVVHTRWHDDDLIGRLTGATNDSGIHWDYINLPAIDEKGKALWPTRWTAEALDEKRRLLGPYDWTSLFLGQPRAKGGRLFQEPTFYDHPDIEGGRLIISCDPAASEKTNANPSVALVLAVTGFGVNQKCYVLDVFKDRLPIPKLVDKLIKMQKKWQSPICVEAVAGFKGVPQALRGIDPTLKVVELSPTTDKFTRALPASAAWNDARILVPKDAPWTREFIDEVCKFTGVKDARDDQVDALAHAFNVLNRAYPPRQKGGRAAPLLAFG